MKNTPSLVIIIIIFVVLACTCPPPREKSDNVNNANQTQNLNSNKIEEQKSPTATPTLTPTPTTTPTPEPSALSSRENLEIGTKAFESGNFELADKHLSEISKTSPEYAKAWEMLKDERLIAVKRQNLATAKENLKTMKRLSKNMGLDVRRIEQLEAEIKRQEKELESRSKK